MLSILYSTNKKPILKVLLMKLKQKKMLKKLLKMPFIYVFNRINEFRQLCIKTSWSNLIQNLFLRGPVVAISWTPWFWSNPSDFQMEFGSEWCFIVVSYQRQQMSVKKNKKNLKKNSLDVVSGQTSVRWKLPLIRPSQTKVTSDQTVPDQSGLWSGKFQTIVQAKVRSKPFPDHVIRAHREHVCARRWSD